MTVESWTAVYGAVVATVVFAWQIWTYSQEHRFRLELDVNATIMLNHKRDMMAFMRTALKDAKPAGTRVKYHPHINDWRIDVFVFNRGRKRVQIRELAISQKERTLRREWTLDKSDEFPLWIEPGEKRGFQFSSEKCPDVGVNMSLKVQMTLAPGRRVSRAVNLSKADPQMTLGFLSSYVDIETAIQAALAEGNSDRAWELEREWIAEEPATEE